MKKAISLTLVFTLLILLLAACAKDGDTSPSPSSTTTSTFTESPPPTDSSFFLFVDDNPQMKSNAFKDTAYMGTDDGKDGSIGVNLKDTSYDPIYGSTIAIFSYTTPPAGDHWSGVALLWEKQGWDKPDPYGLRAYRNLKFWVRGQGGFVKFFVEGDGYSQQTSYTELTDEWQEITIELGNWNYINIPFGWACNESDSYDRGKIIFWIDGLRFTD